MAGVLYCGNANCMMTDSTAITAENTISRTENFLIGIFFAMVGFGMKGVFDYDVEGYGHACQRADEDEQRCGVQPLVQLIASKHAQGNDEHHLESHARVAGIVVQRPGVLGSVFRAGRHLVVY